MNAVPENNDISGLIEKAMAGERDALAELFSRYKSQLRRMIAFRLDQNLKGRVDPSDILQEAYFDLAKRLPEFEKKGMSFFVWLRLVTKERLLRTHREHLEAQKRDARREVPFQANSSVCLAAHLIGRYSSVAGNAIKAEQSVRLSAILEQMSEDDREIIAMRIFEGLTNGETSEVLGLTKQTVSKRFIRAIGRLKEELNEIPGMG